MAAPLPLQNDKHEIPFFVFQLVRTKLESWSQEVPHDSSNVTNRTAVGTAELGRPPTERTKWGMGQGVLSRLTISGTAHPVALNQQLGWCPVMCSPLPLYKRSGIYRCTHLSEEGTALIYCYKGCNVTQRSSKTSLRGIYLIAVSHPQQSHLTGKGTKSVFPSLSLRTEACQGCLIQFQARFQLISPARERSERHQAEQ